MYTLGTWRNVQTIYSQSTYSRLFSDVSLRPFDQKAMWSTPAIHTYPIQVVFQIDQLPGQ